MPDWKNSPPKNFDIVTGFFPESRPKHDWMDNPRPMLVVGVFRGKVSGEIRARVAYGTSKVEKIRRPNLIIGNLSHLDTLNLARPTAFVIHPGDQWAILPWSEQHFAPWRDFATPIIGRLPREMQEHVARIMKDSTGLPMPNK